MTRALDTHATASVSPRCWTKNPAHTGTRAFAFGSRRDGDDMALAARSALR
jgi:hypothetical protein